MSLFGPPTFSSVSSTFQANPIPDFDGPDDVVMEDVEDYDVVPMDIDVPNEFMCCITLSIMDDPWIDPEGHSYERTAIFTWLKDKNESPLTRKPLRKDMLQPNIKLRNLIQSFRRDNPSLNID